MHNHQHPHVHYLKHCTVCDVAYCTACPKEWKTFVPYWTYNIQPSVYGTGTSTGYTTVGSATTTAGGTVTTAVNTTDHTHSDST